MARELESLPVDCSGDCRQRLFGKVRHHLCFFEGPAAIQMPNSLPTAEVERHRDVAPQQPGQPAADRQAQACSTILACCGLLALCEGFEILPSCWAFIPIPVSRTLIRTMLESRDLSQETFISTVPSS